MGFVGDIMGSVAGKGGAKSASYAPQTGYTAEYQALQDAERQKYADKINMLESGQGPSVADAYVQNAQQSSLAQALAQARSARGDMNPAMAYRQALQAAAQGSQQAVQQGAMMRAQEGIAGKQLAQGYAQMGLQGDLANQGAWGQAQGINAGVATQNLGSQTSFGQIGAQQGAGFFKDVLGGAGQGAAMIAASDERVKENIHGGDDKIQGFLDAISPKAYSYKNPVNGPGEYVSPMAQDLEKTPVGSSFVQDTPQGKMVDYGKGFGAILAAQAHLNDRLNQIEGKYAGGVIGMKGGGKVPGKAKVEGDSPKNDTVIAKLSPGEIVIPRTLAEDPDRAKKFIEELQKNKKGERSSYGKVLAAKRKQTA